jgi:phosphotransferase system HPr (HPr) family protein
MKCPPGEPSGPEPAKPGAAADASGTGPCTKQQEQAVCRDVVIRNRQGLHARPVMQFVDVASQFESAISVCKGQQIVDGKSPMEMILLEATEGTSLRLTAEGADAAAAIEALAKLVESGFGED